MDTALPQKFTFILDRNLTKANCTENRVCRSCDIVVLGTHKFLVDKFNEKTTKSPPIHENKHKTKF